MLGNKNAIGTLAVKDLEVARKFYEGTLGLEPIAHEGDELIVYKSGGAALNVYRSEFAGTNQATAMTWDVGNSFDEEVEALKARGVQFEHYDMPGLVEQGDVYVAGTYKIAWFKDPDGNILNLTGE